MTKSNSNKKQKKIFVLGAGVLGLTTALELQQKGYHVTILARDLPPCAIAAANDAPEEDDPQLASQDWASPWAGFNWCSFADPEDIMTQKRDKVTFRRFQQMVKDKVLPREEMAMMDFHDIKSSDYTPGNCWFERIAPEFKAHPSTSSSPAKTTYRSFSVSTPHYLAYLVRSLLNPRDGHTPVTFHQVPTFSSLGSVYSHPLLASHDPEGILLINATGIGSLTLTDVADKAMHPIRGQTVLIRSDHFTHSPYCVMSTLTSKPTYVIPRGASGLVICGGTFDEDDWGREARQEDTERILKDCLEICPELLSSTISQADRDDPEAWRKIEVVSINVGTRPARKGETRVELDAIKDTKDELRPVLHVYGAGKAGYQSSFGIAQEAVDCVEKHFEALGI